MENEERYKACGHVTITDADTGEILADADNMIVESGRTIIANAIYGKETMSPSKFKMFFENDNSVMTKPDMKLSDLNTIINAPSCVENTGTTAPTADDIKSDVFKTNVQAFKISDRVIDFYYTLSSLDKNYYITSLGLEYGETPVLFSRVMFDPIYMRSTRSYSVHYAVKF